MFPLRREELFPKIDWPGGARIEAGPKASSSSFHPKAQAFVVSLITMERKNTLASPKHMGSPIQEQKVLIIICILSSPFPLLSLHMDCSLDQ